MGFFGPSQDEVWQRLREEIDAEIMDSEGWFGPSFPENVDELHFQVTDHIKDVNNLFALVLDRLVAMGSAYREPPGVEL